MTTTYCTDADMHSTFGKTNVDSWADVENDGLESSIVARKDWARVCAKGYLDARLAGCRYKFPLANPASAPVPLRQAEAYYACMLLSESRSITDVEEGDAGDLKWVAKRVEKFVSDVWAGKLTFPGLPTVTGSPIDNAPTHVSFPDPAESSGGDFPVAPFT